tara:strand:- start:196 stop:495 length:300 start_codon:yes stop_codon:yes gene_type:complete
MLNFKLFRIFLFIFFLTSCQTVKQTTDDIIKKENTKLSKFIGQPESQLRIALGEPEAINKNDNNNSIFIYKSKKYGISCERKFEISNNIVIGFISKGCF